jgi:hypothetical protein
VFANYNSEPHCDSCGEKSNVYYLTVEGRLCSGCKAKKQKKEKNI